jgi:DNA polymerase-1
MSDTTPQPTLPARPTLLLVDGSSYLYRAFHAMPDLRGPGGVPTGAIHGMVAMLRRLPEQVGAEHAVCVFDAPGPTFRDAWYPAYKANRSPMPDDLRAQIEPIHEVVRLMGWPVLMVPGIEADDAIGTLARVGEASGHQVVISTGDKDMAQLVTPQVRLMNTMTNEALDEAGVLAKFGVAPNRIIDYLTLIGDTVDNVPGVAKVGPKTAVKWLAEHGSLAAVMAAAASFKGATGDNLRAALDWLPQGERLITIKTDCDLAEHIAGWPDLAALALKPVERVGLVQFYGRFGFRTWGRELQAELTREGVEVAPSPQPLSHEGRGALQPALPPLPLWERVGEKVGERGPDTQDERGSAPPTTPPTELAHDYQTLFTLEALDAWIARLRASPLVALDTETDSLDAMQARIVGISFAVEPGRAAYVPTGHNYGGAPDQLPLELVLARLKPWLEDASAHKLGQHIKYDLHVFANHGLNVRGYTQDTMLQSYVLEAHKPHNLESLAQRHLGRQGLSYESLCGKGANQIPFAQVEVERASTYSGEDSEMCLQLHQTLMPQIAADAGLLRVYETIEIPATEVLLRMERHGVLIDPAKLAAQSQQLAQRMVALEQEVYQIAGQPFNLNSPKQVGEILFGKLGLPAKKKTASGTPSTDEAVLQELASDYPIAAKLLENRSLAKLKGTYTDKLPTMINPATGRVHTHYAQSVAVTGRLSSNDPNLQNIPIRTAEGRRVREAFIAPPGCVMMSADYSQIELRIMAHLSEDPGLLRAFEQGLDVHRATASEVFGIAPEEVSSEQRRYAKTINFGLIYGMGAFGLAQSLGIDQKAARSYIERYFERFAGVKRFMEQTKASAAEHGYVETVFGRRLWLPEIQGASGPRRAGAERQAINAPMQGTAADLIKLAMIAVQNTLDAEQRATRMVMQVHDELVLEVPLAELDWAKEAVPRLMASVADLRVPLLAEVGVGANWDEAH